MSKPSQQKKPGGSNESCSTGGGDWKKSGQKGDSCSTGGDWKKGGKGDCGSTGGKKGSCS